MKKIILFVLCCACPMPGQVWSSFIDSSRAVAWAGHTGFSIPNYTVLCATQPSLSTGIGAAAANATAITNALASCDATHNVVSIPAGTWFVNGITFGTQGKQVLRGAGPTNTTLIEETEVSCGGSPSGLCMVPGTWFYSGNAAVQPPSGTRQCLWTGGYAQGSTSLTLNSCPAAPPNGQLIVLDQANDFADNGGLFLCDSFSTSQKLTISSFTGTSGTLTFTTTTQDLIAGSTFTLTGFTAPNTALNGQLVTVLAAGLTTTTFESTVTGSGYSSGAGGAAPTACSINDGAATNSDGRQIGGYTYSEKQVATILSVSGSGTGPYTVTIAAPGVYFNNIRAGQSPGAWFPGFVQNDGLENMTVDGTAIADTNVQMVACYQCWVRNIKSIDGGRAHVLDYLSFQDTIRDSYVYQNQAHAASSYGFELEQTSDSLVENNICQQQTVCVMEGNSTGSVIGYNFSAGTFYTNTNYLLPQFASHNAGNGLNLWEGNNWPNTATDDTWGSSIPKTFFRNLEPGQQHNFAQITSFTGASGTLTFTTNGQFVANGKTVTLYGFISPNTGLNGQSFSSSGATGSPGSCPCTFQGAVTGSGYSSGTGSAGVPAIYYTQPLITRSFSRANNFVGNVLGQAGYHNTYESYATSTTAGVNGSVLATSIYSLGWGSNAESSAGTCTSPPGSGNAACDPVVRATTMRWGNWDTVNAATQWNSTEASPAAVSFVNANFTTTYFNSLAHTLPNSLYLIGQTSSNCGSGLGFWKNPTLGTCPPFPPIGPDVTNGNVGTCTGTYVGAQATSVSQCTNGTLSTAWSSHASAIPAQVCYLSVMSGPPDGSGSVLSFDAHTCYASDPSNAPLGWLFTKMYPDVSVDVSRMIR